MFTKNLVNQQSCHHLNLPSSHQNFKGCTSLSKSPGNGLSCAFGDLGSLLDAVDILETNKSSLKGGSTVKSSKSIVESKSTSDASAKKSDLNGKTYDFIRESFIIERRASIESPGSFQMSSPTDNYSVCSPISNDASDDLTISEDIRRIRNGHPMGAKIPRKRIKPEVAKTLQDLFDSGTHFPSREERESLAAQLSLTARTIQIWFQNKRQALRNKKMSEPQDDSTDSICRDDDNERPTPTGNDILMTKMTFGRKGGGLSAGQNHILKTPGFLNQEKTARQSIDSEDTISKRKSDFSLPLPRKRFSISELTKENTPRLPLHPNMMAFTPMMQGLPRTLPKIQLEGEIDFIYGSSDMKGRSASLPSIGRALRRSSII